MARTAAAKDYYINTGLKTRMSAKREETESGRMAAYIIDKIPKDFNVYDDCDINEAHLARTIVETCGRWIRYCPQTGWLVYREDEGRWTEAYAEAAVQRVIIHFGNLLWENASQANQGEVSFARRILSSAGIGALKNILKHDTVIAVEQDKFDADPDLLNCMGDAYDLRAGESRKAEPEDLFTKSAMCKAAPLKKKKGGGWEPAKLPKKFIDFLDQVTSKDGEKRADLAMYVLSWFGYCLTGDNGASFFVNFHGAGKNGKSVLLNLMMELFGDYAAPLPKDVVIENYYQSQFDLAGLPGIRLGVLIDAPEGRLNMDMLKPITSGDMINAKRKFLKDFTFKPVCKLAIGSNPRLTLKDTGMAVRRRVRMVPFDYVVPDGEIVTNLHRRLLKEEAPEILSLLIWFAHEYYEKGEGPGAFPSCKAVDEASVEYMESEDLVGRWVKERTESAEGNAKSSASLYEDFKKWLDEEGVRKKMSRNKFGEHLGTHVERKRVGDANCYIGIKLKYAESPPLLDTGG